MALIEPTGEWPCIYMAPLVPGPGWTLSNLVPFSKEEVLYITGPLHFHVLKCEKEKAHFHPFVGAG